MRPARLSLRDRSGLTIAFSNSYRSMTQFLKGGLVLSVLFAMAACTSSHTDRSSSTADEVDDSLAAIDSVEHDQAPAPPPGTAEIRGAVLSCQEDEQVRCEIRIDEVLGYGASTPPVASGMRTVLVRPVVLQNRTTHDLVTMGVRTFRLRHVGDRPQLGSDQNQNSTPAWTITEIRNR